MSITDLNLANVTKVEGGYGHSLAITSDGKLYSWGLNDEGQLGQGNTTNLTTPTQVGTDTDWVDIGCGEKHSIALKSDNAGFYAWGRNTHGQCGSTASTYIGSPTQVHSSDTFTKVDAGANCSVVLDDSGAIFGCGLNEHKCLTSAATTNNISLTNLYGLTGFSLIAAGPQFTAGFIPGTGIYVRGRHGLNTSYYGSTNFATNSSHYYSLFDQNAASLVPNSQNLDIIALDVGRDFLLAIDQAGELYGYTSSNDIDAFSSSSGWDPAQGVPDGTYDCALGHFGIFYLNSHTTQYVVKTNYAEMIDDTKEWHKVECGFDHAILTDIDGNIYSVGNNSYTQLGRTFTGNDTNIVQMESTAATGNWTVIGCGHYHSLLCKGS